MLGDSQRSLTKGESRLTSLIAFYNQMAAFVDEGGAGDIICLGFSKALDIVSHNLVSKLGHYGVDKQMDKKRLVDDRAQRAVVQGLYPVWRPVTRWREAIAISCLVLRPHLEDCSLPPSHGWLLHHAVGLSKRSLLPPGRGEGLKHSLHRVRRGPEEGQRCFRAVEEGGVCFLLWVENTKSRWCQGQLESCCPL